MPAAELDIRLVGAEGEADMAELGERSMEDTRYGAYGLDRGKVAQLAAAGGDEQTGVMNLLAYLDARPVGLLCARVYPHPFAKDLLSAANFALYVVREARGGHIAAALIRTMESEAHARGAREIILGTTSGVRPISTLKLYQRLGYSPLGGLMVKYLED